MGGRSSYIIILYLTLAWLAFSSIVSLVLFGFLLTSPWVLTHSHAFEYHSHNNNSQISISRTELNLSYSGHLDRNT